MNLSLTEKQQSIVEYQTGYLGNNFIGIGTIKSERRFVTKKGNPAKSIECIINSGDSNRYSPISVVLWDNINDFNLEDNVLLFLGRDHFFNPVMYAIK